MHRWIPLAVTAAGFLALYLPTYVGLARTVWTGDEEAHGPIVLAVAFWVLWQARERLVAAASAGGAVAWWPLLALGLACCAVGRMLGVQVLEVGSQPLVLAACLGVLGGWRAVRAGLFALVLLLFVVPLPGNLVDAMTGALKQVVSEVAETALHAAGYPVARSGVVISIGPYQLLVADACSGLRSIFSLTAVGLVYLYLAGHASRLRNALIVLSLVPIAFAANVLRVMALILVTYYFGDAAGQGIAHDLTGMALFVLALGLLLTFDGLLGWLLSGRTRRRGHDSVRLA